MQKNEGKTQLTPQPTWESRGVQVFQGFLGAQAQAAMVADLRAVAQAAPMFSPQTPYGKPMSVKLTAAGDFGWFSDRQGYRYVAEHPNGAAWPKIPASILSVWKDLAPLAPAPECCLVNYYGEGTRMGMHQDKDEADFQWPVVSISLGDDALFRLGNLTRGGKSESIWLKSGDVAVMGGPARLIYHGIDRIKYQSSDLLPQGGRLNVTLRVVT